MSLAPRRERLAAAGGVWLEPAAASAAGPDHFADPAAEERALAEGAGLVDVADRTQIELTGPDRQSFLHQFCTNEIKKLQAGAGCEAFLTTPQGRTQGHFYAFVGPESVVLETVPGQADFYLAHFDRFHFREQVQFASLAERCGELLLAGPRAEDLLRGLSDAAVPTARLAHAGMRVGGCATEVRRVDWTPSGGFLLSLAWEHLPSVWDALRAGGALPVGEAAFHTARIEAGVPQFGRDVSLDNLPQELDRNALAISFTKGCYPGQETVARIDALGHVNRLLRRLRFSQTAVAPSVGMELFQEGKPVGQTTSTGYSHRWGCGVALGFVRRGCHAPGTRLESAVGEVEVW